MEEIFAKTENKRSNIHKSTLDTERNTHTRDERRREKKEKHKSRQEKRESSWAWAALKLSSSPRNALTELNGSYLKNFAIRSSKFGRGFKICLRGKRTPN
jgi:hypothetical protein